MIATHTETEKAIEEALRHELAAMIEVARSEIEQAIFAAQSAQTDGESNDQVDALRAQLTSLDGQLSQVRAGSLAQLQQMRPGLNRSLGANLQTSQGIAQDATLQTGLHISEMTAEQIEALQRSHDVEARSFAFYEAQSADRIAHLAASGGIDVSGYQANRSRIQADIEEARRNRDRVGVFEGQAQLAANNVAGLIKAGGSDPEIEEAKRKAAEARERYLKEKEIEARNAGVAQGLSGAELTASVDSASQSAARDLDELNAKNAAQSGLTPGQIAEVIGIVDRDKRATNALSATGQIDHNASPTVLTDDRSAVQLSKTDMKTLLAANGITPPTEDNGFPVDGADPLEAKKPAASPDGRPSMPVGPRVAGGKGA